MRSITVAWKKKIFGFYLYANRINYTIFSGTINNSELCNFPDIFSRVACSRRGTWEAAISADRRRGRRLNSGRNLRYDFAVIARSNRTTELRSAFMPDNYKSHLITFPRLCFAAIFIGPAIAPALIRDRFNHILTVPRSVRDYYVPYTFEEAQLRSKLDMHSAAHAAE